MINNNDLEVVTTELEEIENNENIERCEQQRSSKTLRNDSAGHDEGGGACSCSSLMESTQVLRAFIVTLYSLGVIVNKIREDLTTTVRYSASEKTGFLIVTVVCLVLPSVMYALYSTAKYVKETTFPDPKSTYERSEAFKHVLKGIIFFLPLKLYRSVDILRFLIRYNKTNCYHRMDEATKEQYKERKANAKIISYFLHFFAGVPQVVLQLFVLVNLAKEDIDYETVYSELLSSSLCVLAICTSVERADDGLMSTVLSRIGWLSIIFSRCLAFAILCVVAGYWVVLLLMIHVLVVTLWLTTVSAKSHIRHQDNLEKLSFKDHVTIFFTLLPTFGFPSLVYWPMLFDLNDHYRPAIYFFVIFAQNVGILLSWYVYRVDEINLVFLGHKSLSMSDSLTFGLILGMSFVGGLTLYLYYRWKPWRTEHWKPYLERLQRKKDGFCPSTEETLPVEFGVYYEYVSVSFYLPLDKSPLELKEAEMELTNCC